MAEIKLKIASVVIGSGEGGGSGVAPYYADLPDKPSINGETLSGDMTSEDLGLASDSQAVPTGGTTGQVLAKKSNADNDVQWVNQQSGGQGTTDYSDLENKPKINNVTLSGNKTAAQLGLQPELVSGTNIKTINSQSIVGSGNITIEGGGTDDYADLTNKPQINSVALSGNKSASELGLATAAQGALAASAYQKPQTGIPSTDLASGVQTSLGKADTAVQQVTVGTTTTGNAGTPASVVNSGTSTAPVLDFTIPRGADAVNPFKGWFDAVVTGEAGSRVITSETQNLPANPIVGDYAYVKTWDISGTAPSQTETPIAKIYECTTAGSWSDSGRTADTSNVQTFESGEEVNETSIDNTHLVNPKDGALPTAEDVLQLKAKLDGVTASETKVMTITDWHPSDKTSGYFKLNGTWYNSSKNMSTIIDVTGCKCVRFLGAIKDGTPPSNHPAWGFLDSNYNPIIDTLTYYAYDNNLSEDEFVELSSSVPEGAKYLIACYKLFDVITTDNFYCYLQSGENVGDFIPDIIYCKKACDTLQFGNNPIGEPISPTNEFSELLIGKTGGITTGNQYQKVYCYPISSKDRYVYVDLHVEGTSTLVGGVWLIDNVSTIVDGGSIPLSDKLNEPNGTSSDNPKDVDATFFVPAGRILVVTYSTYNSNSYLNVYETEYNSQVIANIQNDVAELQDALDETTIDGAKKGNEIYDDLQYGYYVVDEPITGTNVFSELYVSANNEIVSTSNTIWKIYCYPTSTEDRWVYVDEKLVGSSSLPTGGVYLIDNVSFIATGNIIPSEDVLNAGSTQSNRVLQKSFFVPANRILVVTHLTYNSGSFLNVYETEFSSKVVDDIQDDITELQDNIDTTVINTINETLSVDAIPSSTNPLAFVKETAGYTSIFRKMGVIGGSMSTGWHSHNTGTVSANMPEYSCLQFMARLCGAEGHNFSRGGLSARSWPQNDMMEDFYDTSKKCQMYLVQLGNNDLAWHSDHPEYTLGTIADLTPTSGTSIADYTYNTGTFYGNMARIINEIRKIQPRAYVFLSTFLKGYGTVPSDFDYNAAIRNIVDYYSDASNRPTGDELHYYLIDIYEYGQPYSFYSTGIHAGTVKGSHLVATGYNYWAYEFCNYIDWIIKNNMSEFNDVAFVGTDDYN